MTVTLVLSGVLASGCDDQPGSNAASWAYGDDQTITNNTYAPGYGYWHAPYRRWFPYPYNYFDAGRGYYHGGFYSAEPFASPITASRAAGLSAGGRPGASGGGISRGGFGRGFSGRS